MDKLFAAQTFLKHAFAAGNAHSIHSPFLFELYRNVIRGNEKFYCYELMESLRAGLLLKNEKIETVDFGTGQNHVTRSVKSIARRSLKPPKEAQLLFRLTNRFKPKNILEIGTSLGISTLYLSYASPEAQIITLEGSPPICEIAETNFKKLKRKNIRLVCGDFKDNLAPAVNEFKTLDMVFFDGNHRKESTINYFNLCLEKVNATSVFIVDDIHWSRGMYEAWDEIRRNERVVLDVDLYSMGLLFFNDELSRQSFRLRF